MKAFIYAVMFNKGKSFGATINFAKDLNTSL